MEPDWIKGNSDMLHRAILNYTAENALYHTPSGTGVEILVEADGIIRVLDSGPGIQDHEREFLFRRFWRRERSRAGGAGLGLAIVKRIADLHGAVIAVENRPSGGASFSLSFVRFA